MNNFTYKRETNLIFGQDQLSRLGKEIGKYGSRVLLTYGQNSIKKTGLYDKVVNELKSAGLFFVELGGIKPNPEVDTARKGVELIKEHKIDFILAVGGGSVIDNSKHMAISAALNKDIWEIILDSELLKGASAEDLIPLGTVLTICATGSEMNMGGVITNPETMDKMSTGHPGAVPKFSFLDPTVLETLPSHQRSAGLCDIWSHLFENYFDSHNDDGFKDRIAESLILNVKNYSERYMADKKDYEANAQIMICATYGLNGITDLGGEGGDWSAHAIEHKLSGINGFTHGTGLGLIHPRLIEVFLKKDIKAGNSLVKYVNIGKNVFGITDGSDEEIAKKSVSAIKDMFLKALGKSKLSEYEGFDYEKTLDLLRKSVKKLLDPALNAGELSQHYLQLDEADLFEIIDEFK